MTEHDRGCGIHERRRGRAEGMSAAGVAVAVVGISVWIAVGGTIEPAMLLMALLSTPQETLTMLFLCATICFVWSAWSDVLAWSRHPDVPTCPYCPPERIGSLLYPRPATRIMEHGRWAWCDCGALYVHFNRTWVRPKPRDGTSLYRDDVGPAAAGEALEALVESIVEEGDAGSP